jgi:hypothetical protein
MSFGKYFWSMLFYCVASFHGLAHSPDLSAWQYPKVKVYTNRPWTIDDDLKIAIRNQISVIQETQLGEHWETHEQGWKIVYKMMGNILVIWSSKRK